MDYFKKWWFTLLFILGGILDLGFDVVNPILIDLGLSIKFIAITKVIFIIYSSIKLKREINN